MRTKEIPPLAGGASNEYADSIISEKSIIVKLNQLFIGERHRYLVQYRTRDGTVVYSQIRGTLTDKLLHDHISADQTLGVFYCGRGSKFLCFDVDDMEPIKTQGIVTVLKRVGLQSHIEFSGSKGYHVWVFFDDTLPIKTLVAFGKWVIGQMGEYSDHIELRPESTRGKGVKLPFALHNVTGNMSCWVNYDLEPYADQYDYFMQIQSMSKDDVSKCINEALKLSEVRTLQRRTPGDASQRSTETKREMEQDIKPQTRIRKRAERLLSEGITPDEIERGNGRHNCQWIVAMYLRDQGLSESECTERVTEWAIREKRAGRAESSESHIITDVKHQVRQVYREDMRLWDAKGERTIEVYQSDIAYAAQFKRRTVRKIVFALIIYGRLHHENGVFFIDQHTLAETARVSPTTVNKVIRELCDDGVIELRKKGYFKIGADGANQSKASEYYMPHLETVELDGAIGGNTIEELYATSYRQVERMVG